MFSVQKKSVLMIEIFICSFNEWVMAFQPIQFIFSPHYRHITSNLSEDEKQLDRF